MRPAVLSLLLGLVLLSAVTAQVTAPPEKPCVKEREKALNVMPGFVGNFVPQCDENGDYNPEQCHSSTGYCWCVDKQGTEIPGTSTPPGTPRKDCTKPAPEKPCIKEREKALKVMPGYVGHFVPQCDKNGDYRPMQCHSSTGYCWCVDAKGKEIAGTRTPPGTPRKDCTKPVEKPGKCQVIPTFKKCDVDPKPECKSDGDCKGAKKCCDYACHMQCRDPIG